MRLIRPSLFTVLIGLLSFSFQACKSKKMVVKPSTQVETTKEEPEEKQPEPAPKPEPKPEPAPEPEKPNYNFKNIQFEFDSDVLKTESYPVLDAVAREMKKDPAARFALNGHSSIEGTAEYNQALSEDRANAVKLYLVNAGINSNSLITKGFGATQPIATNDNETGRALNRRVEIKVIQ